jgi:hypothetical protein
VIKSGVHGAFLQNEVADYLTEIIGIKALCENTSAGHSIIIESATRHFTFGTAGGNWAADITKKNLNGGSSDLEPEFIETKVSSGSKSVELVAKGIAVALIRYDRSRHTQRTGLAYVN